MMKSILLFTFLFFPYLIKIDGLKVLGVLPFGSKSHWLVGHQIIKSLVDAGHEATVLTPFPMKETIRNYEEIDISDILKIFEQDESLPMLLRKLPSIISIGFLHYISNTVVKGVMENPNVVEFMKRREKYDVCFLEVFHSNALAGIFEHFDCVYIPYSSSTVTQWVDVMTSNISPSSYVVTPILPYAGPLSFKQRFWNALHIQIENLSYYLYNLPSQRSLYKKYFPNAKKSFDDMISSAAIIFLSNHVSVTRARPYLPNMIEIGGIHIVPKKPLPKDIKEFLDYAPDGVVLFTMGSIVKAKLFPENIREAFVNAFRRIKQKVLWKYENDTLPNKPENVMISSWLPQRDILAHANVRLFISHGGYLGTSEAASEGVPMLGIPFYGDQGRNIADIVYQERGLSLDFDDITEENVFKLLNELLNNPKFKKNAEIVARRFNDRIMTPQQEVVYWTEYAVRHKGAPFLRATGNDLNTFEFYSIDVYGLLIIILLMVLFINYKITKFMLIKLKSRWSTKQKQS